MCIGACVYMRARVHVSYRSRSKDYLGGKEAIKNELNWWQRTGKENKKEQSILRNMYKNVTMKYDLYTC